MHLAVLGNDIAVFIENKAGIIKLIPVLFGYRPADKDNAVFPCPGRHLLHALSVFGIGKATKILL